MTEPPEQSAEQQADPHKRPRDGEGDRETRLKYCKADLKDCEHRQDDLRTIRKQVANFDRRRRDPEWRREIIRLAQQRRKDTDLVQFDVLPEPGGEQLLVVRGELLIRADAFDDRARRIATQYGLNNYEAVDCLKRRVIRLHGWDRRPEELPDVADALQRQDVPVSYDFISPSSIVMKGEGGPEPSARQGPERQPVEPGRIRVAVIDTGISDEQRRDGWLNGLADGNNIDLLDAIPRPDGLLDLGAGHGTFTAGLVQQTAPAADLAVYAPVDSDGVAREISVACAMVEAARAGLEEGKSVVLNLSLGTETLNDQPPVALEVALDIIDELEAAADHGQQVLVVAAAGNNGRSRPCWPAAFRRVISVAALTQDLWPATWSSYGFWVDCSTIGEGVRSTYVKGQEMPEMDREPDKFGENAWALWSGTSFAAPQVAGKVALIAERDGISLRRAFVRLLAGAPRIPDFGRAVRIQEPA